MHNNFHRIPKKKKIIKFAQFNLKYNILKRPTKFISKQNIQIINFLSLIIKMKILKNKSQLFREFLKSLLLNLKEN